MASYIRQRPPAWFTVAAILLVLWEAMGVSACVMQLREGPASWGPVDDWARSYYAALPVWYNPAYVVATFGGLLGAISLLLRRAWAVPLFWISLIATVVMFGYAFAATDLIAHKGAATVVPFPLIIVVVGVLAVRFAGRSRRRGWIN